MHSPEVMVFDLHVPVPSVKWRNRRPPQWQVTRRRYTCPEEENPLCGEAINPWWRPAAWEFVLADRRIGWLHVADVWHYEPDDRDSGEVCKGMGGSDLTWPNVKWAWAHRDHVEIHWRHARKVKRWLFLRCSECGKPFRGDYRAVSGTWDGDEHWHTHCASILRLTRTQEVLAGFIVDGGDQWLARRWAEQIRERSKQPA